MSVEKAPILDVEHLALDVTTREGTTRLVDDISLTIGAGETVGLVGESGSGKSLTALAILRLLPSGITQSGGTIRFDGRDMQALSDRELRALRGSEIAVIFQDPQNSLNPAYTVGNQLVESIRVKNKGVSKREAQRTSVELLDRVGIDRAEERLRQYPYEFSGGMAQRVMIALAIANRPRLLVADEPTTALDVTVQEQILALLESLRAEFDMSLLLISHDLGVVGTTADRVTVVYAGQRVETGTVREALMRPLHPYTEALLAAQPEGNEKGKLLRTIDGSVPSASDMPEGCRFAGRCAYTLPVCLEPQVWVDVNDTAGVRCVRHGELRLTGFIRAATVPAAAIDTTPVASALLTVTGLGKEYGTRSRRFGGDARKLVAVDDVSFQIAEGETLGLVGESGAGKSTIGRLILGLAEPTSGSIVFDGADISRGSRPRSLSREIQVIFQNPYATLDPLMRVGESIAEPIEAHERLSKAARRDRVALLLTDVGLDRAIADRYPHQLSGGQRQRVAIARALALRPRLVVCDEPVSALDVSTQAQVINLLKTVQEEHQLAYLFIGHDLGIVYHISDRVAVMRNGRIIECGPAEAVYSSPSDPYTKQLLASQPLLAADIESA
ncbi:MAG: ABC transporter ATP-binding protein [Acidimicrobiia bacterium]